MKFHSTFLVLIFCFVFCNSFQPPDSIIEIASPGVTSPKKLFKLSEFTTSNNYKSSKTRIRRKITSKENSEYDILGNKWNEPENVLTEKGFSQGSFLGRIINNHYSKIMKLEKNFSDYNLFIPIETEEENYLIQSQENINSVAKINAQQINYISVLNSRFSDIINATPDNLSSFSDTTKTILNERPQLIDIINKEQILENNSAQSIQVPSADQPNRVSLNQSNTSKTANTPKSQISKILPIRSFRNNLFSFGNKINTCLNALSETELNIKKEKLNQLATEFDSKWKSQISQNLIHVHREIFSYLKSKTSSFSEVASICSALEIAIVNNNLNGFDTKFEKKDDLLSDCRIILKKNIYHAELGSQIQTQAVVRNFFLDLIEDINQILNSTKAAENKTSSTIVFNFYDKIKVSMLKKYTLLINDNLFIAGIMKFLFEAFNTKKYYPEFAGSIFIEFQNNDHLITIYYNNYMIINENMSIFAEKVKENLLTEKEVLKFCGVYTSSSKIINAFFYLSLFTFMILTGITIYYLFLSEVHEKVEGPTEEVLISEPEKLNTTLNFKNFKSNKLSKNYDTLDFNTNTEINRKLTEDLFKSEDYNTAKSQNKNKDNENLS